ncbi:MAG: hypothetical protein AVDCRST_MAG01-01-2765, partial [uncultured Rubrobacteraceae bacterium]
GRDERRPDYGPADTELRVARRGGEALRALREAAAGAPRPRVLPGRLV